MFKNSGRTRTGFVVVGLGLIVLGAVAGVAVLGNVRGRVPEFSIGQGETPLAWGDPLALGAQGIVTVSANAPESGLCGLEGSVVQDGRSWPIFSYSGDKVLFPSDRTPMDQSFEITIAALRDKGLKEGAATLTLAATDCALFAGHAEATQAITVDWTAPRVELLSGQHYVNQGGADVALYRTSPDTAWSGIRLGPNRFRGYKNPKSPEGSGDHFAFFVYSYELPADTPIEIVAVDAAGNEGKATLAPARFFPKEFRKREIGVDDGFINTKIADVIANTPELENKGDPLANFLLVNRELRQKNSAFLMEIAKQSEQQFLWRDAFVPLGNAAVEANFADRRDYLYNGQKVDEQVHLGFDLAVVEQTPIPAGASGKVLFTGYLGIYGNTILIDHGYGMMTLYGHLSEIAVRPGDTVIQNQIMGKSGQTGLAGGDHLHFSMLIQGVQTVPIEFWDQHWIDDHVYLRLGKDLFPEVKEAAAVATGK